MPKAPSVGKARDRPLRIAIILDLDWPYKRQIDVYQGVIEKAEQLGWEHVLIPLAEGFPTKSDSSQPWASLPFDGIIARATEGLAREAAKQRIPLVNVWLNSPVRPDVPTVSVDFTETGRRAARHLMVRGFRSLGFLGGRGLVDSLMKYAGMLEVAREYGVPLVRMQYRHNYNRTRLRWEEYQMQMHEWISSLPTPAGICTDMDLHARYVIEKCMQMGFGIPEDIAVIGEGNESFLCLQPEPAISSIDLGFHTVGVRSVELLADLIAGKKPPPSNLIQIRGSIQLVARHSTDTFAVDDPLVAAALKYIAGNCHLPINVSDVIDNVPASRRSLERRFTTALNRSIAAEICRLRVRRIERLLIDTDERIELLAEQCGFSDSEQMRRNFKLIHGISPSQYRQQHKV